MGVGFRGRRGSRGAAGLLGPCCPACPAGRDVTLLCDMGGGSGVAGQPAAAPASQGPRGSSPRSGPTGWLWTGEAASPGPAGRSRPGILWFLLLSCEHGSASPAPGASRSQVEKVQRRVTCE